MNALLLRWGVDPIQWRALVRALLRIDFPVMATRPTAQEKKQSGGLALVLFVYGMYGVTPFVIILAAKDLLFGATIAVILSAFAVAMTLLVGEAAELLSANDLTILGHRPVSSRTYLAVRVTTLLVRSMIISAATTFLPALAYLMSRGVAHPQFAIAVIVATQLSGIAATFAIVVLYALLLERAGAERVKRYVAYAQAAAGFLIWGGFFVFTQQLVKRFVAGIALTSVAWLFLPATWFASVVMLAGGQLTAVSVIGPILAVGSIVILARFIRDKLSMTYAESLARISAQPAKAAATSTGNWLPGVRNETRAVLLLVRGQMLHDMKFRLALISLLPITVVYMFMGGWPTDPFVPSKDPGIGMTQMIVLILPMLARQVLVQSESYRAAWIFHTTPSDRARLLVASRNVITAFFILPYLALVAAFFSFAYGSSLHALVHTGFMGLLAAMILQFDILVRSQLPFSMPPGKDTRVAAQLIVMLVGGGLGTGFYILLVKVIYRSTGRMLLTVAGCLALLTVMEWITRFRIRRKRVEDLYVE